MLLFCRVLFSRAQNQHDQLDVDAIYESTIRIFSSEASGLPSDQSLLLEVPFS